MDIIWNKRFPYRVHSLHRWVLCSLTPVPEGVDRWRLYYVQRRQQEKRFGRIPKMKRHDVPVSDLYFLSQFFTCQWDEILIQDGYPLFYFHSVYVDEMLGYKCVNINIVVFLRITHYLCCLWG